MAVLVLLNGPPASGKSTIAQCFVYARPLSLAARSLVLVMAETHLAAGRVGGYRIERPLSGYRH